MRSRGVPKAKVEVEMDHRALYKQTGSQQTLSSLRHSLGSSIRSKQVKQRDLLFTFKRFKVKTLKDSDEFIPALQDEELVKVKVQCLKQGKKLPALASLSNAFARRSENADLFLRVEGLQRLQTCFHSSDVEVLHAAALCCVNLTAGVSNSDTLMALAPIFIQFLQGSDPTMQELCAWSLGNLVGDSDSACKASTLQGQGCVHALMGLVATPGHLSHPARSESVFFALINLARGRPSCVREMQCNGMFELVQSLFQSIGADSGLNLELGWLLDSIYSRKETFAEQPEQFGVVAVLTADRLIKLTNYGHGGWSERILLPFIHCLANMLGTDVTLAQTLLERNELLSSTFHWLLLSDSELVVKEVLSAVFNCMVGLCSRLLITFHQKLCRQLLALCHHKNALIALQALAVLEMMTKTSSFVDSYLLHQGLVGDLKSLLEGLGQEGDQDISKAALSLITSLRSSCPPV